MVILVAQAENLLFFRTAPGTGPSYRFHLRQKGYKQDRMHDFIASNVIK
jgi:hypothetical protein